MSALTADEELASKLEQLTLASRASSLAATLENLQLSIFSLECDLGYLGWKPQGRYRSLSKESAAKLVSQMGRKARPPQLMDLSTLELPWVFAKLPRHIHKYSYPYAPSPIIGLIMAKERLHDWKTLDFVFGGSSLNLLATKDRSSMYFCTRVPSTSIILVAKATGYAHDSAAIGLQFERLVTGGDPAALSSMDAIEHLQVVRIGDYRVLIQAEVDAVNSEGQPVEIKSSPPSKWRTKVMWQMLSSASTQLCAFEVKPKEQLESVKLWTLEQVVERALRNRSVADLKSNILEGMQALVEQMKDAPAGETRELSWHHGRLVLQVPRQTQAPLLPREAVVRELLAQDVPRGVLVD